ncbi:hypothetical protein Hanom_Chr03g00202581 [Helianthus anomalus]
MRIVLGVAASFIFFNIFFWHKIGIILPLVEMSGCLSLMGQPFYYFIHTLKLRFLSAIVFLSHWFKSAAGNNYWNTQFIILYPL